MESATGARPDLHVALVAPAIPWNTGNIGRTCLAAGARLHLVEPVGFATDGRAVRRAGLDYWAQVDPVTWPGWAEFEAALPALGDAFFFSAEGARDLWEIDFPARAVLVFGREDTGLSPALRARYRDRLVRLPMREGAIRSLNLSTCVGIALYEAWRQQGRRA